MTGQHFPDLSSLKFLVIDDLAFSRTLARSLLVASGAGRVDVAANADEGWRTIRALSPDLVVLDWELAGQSGLELCRLVRLSNESPNPFLAILMVTAYREEHRVRDAIKAGVSTYLAKPFSPGKFLNKVQFCIEDRRAFVRATDRFGPVTSSDTDALFLG